MEIDFSAFEVRALFSEEEPPLYRYTLRREFETVFSRPGGVVVSIGYNPSKAGFIVNDPTIDRECAFCRSWGMSVLIKTNIFAGIATDPDALEDMEDPVGIYNDIILLQAAEYAAKHKGILLACWGVPKGRKQTQIMAKARINEVMSLNLPLHYLRLTRSGAPEHPLYLPSDLTPTKWSY